MKPALHSHSPPPTPLYAELRITLLSDTQLSLPNYRLPPITSYALQSVMPLGRFAKNDRLW